MVRGFKMSVEGEISKTFTPEDAESTETSRFARNGALGEKNETGRDRGWSYRVMAEK